MEGRLSKLPLHGESSLILFSGRDKGNTKIFWTLVILVNPCRLRILHDLEKFDCSLVTGSESKSSLS